MTSAESTAPVEPAPKKRRRWVVWVAALLLVPILLTWIYTFFVLTWSYSDGERAGVLQKFSRKGWLCKTNEGELALYVVAGVQPKIWHFSVRDPDVVPQLSAAVGKKVQLHYEEHRGLPSSCFGETSYFVDKVTVQE